MGLINTVRAFPGEVKGAITEEVTRAYNKDWTHLSRLVGWAHEGVTGKFPRDDAGKIRKLASVAALVMKAVYVILAYPIGLPLAAVGTFITGVTNSFVGAGRAVGRVYDKVLKKKKSVSEETKSEETKSEETKSETSEVLGPVDRAKEFVKKRFSKDKDGTLKGGTPIVDAPSDAKVSVPESDTVK